MDKICHCKVLFRNPYLCWVLYDLWSSSCNVRSFYNIMLLLFPAIQECEITTHMGLCSDVVPHSIMHSVLLCTSLVIIITLVLLSVGDNVVSSPH